jgi:hypothetical protein
MPRSIEEHASVESPTFPSFPADDPVSDFSVESAVEEEQESQEEAFCRDE